MEHKTVGFAVCGSFCTHHRAMEALEAVKARYDHVIPIVSEVVADTDTRFGTAHDLMREMERICDHRVIATQKEAEPIGPKGLLDLLIIAPAPAAPWASWPAASPTPPSPWPPRPTCATAAPSCWLPLPTTGWPPRPGTWGS